MYLIDIQLIFTWVDMGFLGVTISHVTLSCSKCLYNVLRISNSNDTLKKENVLFFKIPFKPT